MKALFLTLLSITFGIQVFANETNQYFFTLDDSDVKVLDSQAGTNESLPADEYPEGNWGTATNGILVSLRFNKPAYTNGEPIIATILVRNVGDSTVDYDAIYVAGRDGPVRFIATANDNREMKPIQWGAVSAHSASIPVGGQKRFSECFDKDYALPTGVFFVQAYVMPDKSRVYAESAKVRIEIR